MSLTGWLFSDAVECLVSVAPELPNGRSSGRRDSESRRVHLDLLQVRGTESHLQADCPLDDDQALLNVRLEAIRM